MNVLVCALAMLSVFVLQGDQACLVILSTIIMVAEAVLFFGSSLHLSPHSVELQTQKLKSHLVRTKSLRVFPVKPGVGQYIAIHATLTARDFFLISTLPVHSPAFFPNLS